jgi:signal transduction histidine kinase
MMSYLSHIQESLIVVVDDDPASLDLSERILHAAGYTNVKACPSPGEALQVIEHEEIDLLVADLQMPEIDGLNLLTRLKASVPEDGFVPVLIVTSDDLLQTRRNALALGADDFLTKPIDVVEMTLRVRHLLRMRKMHVQLSNTRDGLEFEVIARTEELRSAMARLEDLVRAKDIFIASVSHELRTPLTAVLGFASELAAESSRLTPDEVAASARIIAEQATDLSAIIEDLLVAARRDIQAVSVLSEEVAIVDEIHAVIRVMNPADQARIGPVEGQLLVRADRLRVRQILRNLLNNAVRHGGPNIQVELGAWNGFSTVTVLDDGTGIPPEFQAGMFEPYFHGVGDPGQPASIGLGLAVSRFLARLMEGEVDFVPQATGTGVRLSLPAVQ